MPYMCTLCNKYHADKYHKHKPYRKNLPVKTQEEFDKAFFETRIGYLEQKIEGILDLLNKWGIYIEMRHPYWKINKKFRELVKR